MLSQDVTRYVDLHRAMGFKFRSQHLLLRSFARFAEERGDKFITTASAVEWAGQAPSAPQRHNRIATVRRFALAMHAEEPSHQVPPGEIYGRNWFKRRSPYIYTRSQISCLVAAAEGLLPQGTIRPRTYATLFSLLAATGMRVSEAIALNVEDLTDDGIVIRETKFKKSRLVPVHETTRAGLADYLKERGRAAPKDRALLISCRGTRLVYGTVENTFLNLVRAIGLRGKRNQRGPRMHDLRHTFAVRSLEQCVGADRKAIARHMVALSTYLGHAHVADTYWYLQATPLLMHKIAIAGEELHKGRMS